jgi:hypothetical protein
LIILSNLIFIYDAESISNDAKPVEEEEDKEIIPKWF